MRREGYGCRCRLGGGIRLGFRGLLGGMRVRLLQRGFLGFLGWGGLLGGFGEGWLLAIVRSGFVIGRSIPGA